MRSLFWIRAGYIIGAVFLIQYWIDVYFAFNKGQLWSHKNYWGADISTVGFAIVLAFCTIALILTLPKYWNGR